MLTRIGTASTDRHVTAVRGVLHGTMALYLARYLNVPPARIPGDGGEQLDDLPVDPETISAPYSTPSTGRDRSISPQDWWHGISRSAIRRSR